MQSSCERKPELGGNQANSPLLPLVLEVEFGDLGFPFIVLTLVSQLLQEQRNVPVLVNLLQERSPVSFLVKVLPAELINIDLQPFRNSVHVAFGEEHSLRSPKAPERGVAMSIGLAYPAADVGIWYLITAVQVGHASVHN